ncbi:MAG TPA: hypothetical protein VGJ87_05015 [Roseiflexaceae bacterium]|jgi:hypothetical protein
MGYCYLIHLDRPLAEGHTARHYLGFSTYLPARMEAHRNGTGSRFMQVARERGISWSIARIWPGDRWFERKLKRRKMGPRMCPICRQAARRRDQLPLDLEDDLL